MTIIIISQYFKLKFIFPTKSPKNIARTSHQYQLTVTVDIQINVFPKKIKDQISNQSQFSQFNKTIILEFLVKTSTKITLISYIFYTLACKDELSALNHAEYKRQPQLQIQNIPSNSPFSKKRANFPLPQKNNQNP